MSGPKIFGIGLAKTGTTSLNEALRILGYSTIDYPLELRGVERHDAATDLPIADKFEVLDQQYPGSKFIYTIRERADWLKSSETHWARLVDDDRLGNPETARLVKRLYGTVNFNAEFFARAYERHEARVLRYFEGRPDDLLVIDICGGDSSWIPICSFLKREIPKNPFPHVNRTKSELHYHVKSVRDTLVPDRYEKQLKRIRRKGSRLLLWRRSS